MKLRDIKNKNEIIGKIFSQNNNHTPRTKNRGFAQHEEHLLPHEKFILLDAPDFGDTDTYYLWLKILYKEAKIGWICVGNTDELYENL